LQASTENSDLEMNIDNTSLTRSKAQKQAVNATNFLFEMLPQMMPLAEKPNRKSGSVPPKKKINKKDELQDLLT